MKLEIMRFKNKTYKGLQYFGAEVVKIFPKGPDSNILGFVAMQFLSQFPSSAFLGQKQPQTIH